MKQRQTKLAVFDIDGTIFRSSLVIALTQELVAEKIFPSSAAKDIAKDYLAWVNRKGTYEAYIDRVVKIYLKHIQGKSFKQVKNIAKKVIKYHKDRVYRYTRDLIKKLKKQNYFLLAISGSPSLIVEEYARTIGFNKFFGTEIEVIDGKFTANLNAKSAYHKSEIVKQLAKDLNLDLKKSIAIGDTEGDIQMLSLVGKPIAFNPNARLAKVAKKQNWEIVVERKDVIFKINKLEFLHYED